MMFLKQMKSRSGQGVVEYILLLAFILGIFAIFNAFIESSEFGKKVTEPISVRYKSVYQFGKVGVTGLEDNQTPEDHPRAEEPAATNFRIFINPVGGG